MLRELVAEAQPDSETLDLCRDRFFDRRRSYAADALQRGIDAGRFRSDLDITTAIDARYASLRLRLLTGHAALTPKAVTSIVDTVTGGIDAP